MNKHTEKRSGIYSHSKEPQRKPNYLAMTLAKD